MEYGKGNLDMLVGIELNASKETDRVTSKTYGVPFVSRTGIIRVSKIVEVFNFGNKSGDRQFTIVT